MAEEQVPPERILTAFDTTPWNTFLGYYMSEGEEEPQPPVQKKAQGVIWGKDPRCDTQTDQGDQTHSIIPCTPQHVLRVELGRLSEPQR